MGEGRKKCVLPSIQTVRFLGSRWTFQNRSIQIYFERFFSIIGACIRAIDNFMLKMMIGVNYERILLHGVLQKISRPI